MFQINDSIYWIFFLNSHSFANTCKSGLLIPLFYHVHPGTPIYVPTLFLVGLDKCSFTNSSNVAQTVLHAIRCRGTRDRSDRILTFGNKDNKLPCRNAKARESPLAMPGVSWSPMSTAQEWSSLETCVQVEVEAIRVDQLVKRMHRTQLKKINSFHATTCWCACM